AGRLERRDERERPRRRRSVVVGDPEGEVDQGRRQLVEELPRRNRPHARRRLLLQPDHDAALPPRAELDGQHRALADVVLDLVGERMVERPRRDQRDDGGIGHAPSLAPAPVVTPARARRRGIVTNRSTSATPPGAATGTVSAGGGWSPAPHPMGGVTETGMARRDRSGSDARPDAAVAAALAADGAEHEIRSEAEDEAAEQAPRDERLVAELPVHVAEL